MADEPKPPNASSDPNDTKAAYFARLDAAFAKLSTSPMPPASAAAPTAATAPSAPATPPATAIRAAGTAPPAVRPGTPVPGSTTPSAGVASAASKVPAGGASGLVAEAFAALLALEDGEPGARPVRLTTRGSEPPPAPPQITDAIMQELVRRVIERLGPEAVRAVVTDVVSEVSERLVKEEIDRIRKKNA